MMQIQGSAGDYSAKTLYELEPSQFGSTQQTPIFYDHHIFGIRERDKQFVCLDLEGNEVWSSGTQQRFGSGPYLIADGKIYILDDFATLTMAEATVEGYRPLDQATMLEGHDAWAPMALVQGRLILRDLTTMLCVDLRPR
jgi:outer membrane protein assembly factor BamB